MKKLLLISFASSFILFSCTKENTVPSNSVQEVATTQLSATTSTNSNAASQQGSSLGNSSSGNPIFLGPPVQDNNCFTLSNTETNLGFVEYRVTYTDCKGVVHDVPLPMGENIRDCMQSSTIQTNFSYTLKSCN